MYYILYLASLCKRRHWSEPNYDAFRSSTGYTCVVRVNNREYKADSICESEIMARENAAMRAYLICRNFSVNDGMYPAGHDHGGVLQGIPVAIGTGRGDRTSRYSINNASSTDESDSTSISGDSRSGGSSPESHDGARLMSHDHDRRQGVPARALIYRY
ncbi:hypothetical protein UA08_04796 [Talaromyces atroroseus]|uniref:DRBM domain-containing protein n=1 Tax=Talaromyces atroroseus TaxID=1441469 RepID=A0A225ALJ0_TALAT|nr:hypothetical protein UA08_04796 [Talaromyces atroroseus]OKL60263.1 hypothetical protein UA08_04796 [Talaromyces atroroseus]